jgi:GTP-binding protein
MAVRRTDVRNVAIIAHVDHGKTTMVDALLEIAGAFERGEIGREQALDSGDLERERGITITSKPTALVHDGVRINIVDTPGHADFGGEVERVLHMVDGVLLLVDAVEGPMPQTRFVTEKAVGRGLKVLLVVNKIDRAAADPHRAVDLTFDLLVALGATEEQLDFPVIYASGRERYTKTDPAGERESVAKVLDMVVQHVPPPAVDVEGPPAMWVSTLHHDPYVGYLAIGRIQSGRFALGQRVALVRPEPDGAPARAVEVFRVQKVLGFQGLRRFELPVAEAGDIVAIAGMETLQVGDTLTAEAPDRRIVFPALTVDPPTLSIRIRTNDGPFAGLEGQWVTSRKLRERLYRELRSNVALHVRDTESPDEFEVEGRGELHLSVLIETMRREGYELCVARPKVILREDHGRVQEPYERVLVQCDSEFTGAVIEHIGKTGELLAMEEDGPGRTRLEFKAPTRSLIGYRSEFLTQTRGTGVISSVFDSYGPWLGVLKSRQNGVMIVMERGETSTYSLHRLQDRGPLFVGPHSKVYAGQIIGAHVRDVDIIVNPNTAKKLTNIRTTAADEKLFLTPPRVMSLEQALAFIADDELVEVTPKSIRLRKRILDHNERKRVEKKPVLEE